MTETDDHSSVHHTDIYSIIEGGIGGIDLQMNRQLTWLSTRMKAKEIARDAEQHGQQEIDLTGVEFISRAFAAELVTQVDERALKIVGADEDVERMLDVVRK